MVINKITELVGNTPLLLIDPKIHGLKNINLYAKLELFNPFGSLKDRIAWGILKDDIESIKEKKQTIIESSSGNTAKAMQAIASIHGIPFRTVTNRIKIPEVKQILQLMGTEIEELPGLSECPDPNDPNDPISYIENITSKDPEKYYHTRQYTNPKNPQTHYETTGKEIWEDLQTVDFFIGGLGTAGSTMGTAKYLKEKNAGLKTIGVVAEKGDLLPGIRNLDEMHEVGIFSKDDYDDIIAVSSLDATDMMLTLIRECGVLAGPTSGASMLGGMKYLKKIDATLTEKKNAVFIVCDRVELYNSYLQKRRPDLYGASNKNGLHQLTKEEILTADVLPISQAETWIAEHKPIIVDIRGNLGYRTGHIAGAINITDTEFETLVEVGIPFSNNQKVLLICPIGEQSKKYAVLLAKKGIDAKSLEGGIVGWRDAGKALERTELVK